MNYDEEIRGILADTRTLDIGTRRLHWALARTVPDAIARVAADKIIAMRKQNEAFDLAGSQQHETARSKIASQETRTRLLAASVQRFQVEPAAKSLRQRLQTVVSTMENDALLSAPGALDGLNAGGMVQLGILRELRQRRLERTDFDGLLPIYREALRRGDASALIDIEYVERVALSKTAATEDQIEHARALRELVEGTREMRVDIKLDAVEHVIRAAETCVTRCDLVPAHPINPETDQTARAAHEAETAAFQREASNQ
ncbi:MAG TPA: hypothetical protein VM818_17500 [Vicinamibacterales bacterium]|jgi:hypothetical protein|nr:hypothetical protein [Vicinamibacterales bacterium]